MNLPCKGRNPLRELVGNPGCQPGLATSFQLVRLVGCGLNMFSTRVEYWNPYGSGSNFYWRHRRRYHVDRDLGSAFVG